MSSNMSRDTITFFCQNSTGPHASLFVMGVAVGKLRWGLLNNE
jgi:hypothetical protein